jgi:gluconolactonase
MIFAEDVQKPEGPVALLDGSWLIVEGSPERGCITHLSSDGKSRRAICKTGRPNGLAVDVNEVIWVAESKIPSLLRLTMDGHCEVVATMCDGEPFLFPNDLCFGPDGAIYMTDSGVSIDAFAPNGQIRTDYATVHYDGRVYRIDPQTGSVRLIDRAIRFTNGIAFGADDRLYVNETVTGYVYRYEWIGNEVSGPRAVFGNVVRVDAPPGWKGPDGMAFDELGFLYVAVFGQGDITILGLQGEVVSRIPTLGMLPTNLAFAASGASRILVTEYEHAQMEIHTTDSNGLRLWDGRKRVLPQSPVGSEATTIRPSQEIA